MRRFVSFASLLALLFPTGELRACLWDSETLAQEREKFPGTLELITGKFLRHSDDYYRWRLADRQARLKNDGENDRLLDDIAVSYEKLGNHQEAIRVAREQLSRSPQRYESLANLGTFLIHDGQFAAGLEYIDQALAVNPDAHFGREKYQRLLVRYLLHRFPEGEISLPLSPRSSGDGFVRFLAQQFSDGEKTSLDQSEVTEAIKGVSGMMRFSRHDHPVLLDVLGQLLLRQGRPTDDAKRLSARCFWMASYQVENAESKQAYQKLAANALSMQVAREGLTRPVRPAGIERRFQRELQQGTEWFAELQKLERAWIAAGENVDERFQEHYRKQAPKISLNDTAAPMPIFGGPRSWLMGGAILAGLSLLVLIGFRFRRRPSDAASMLN